MCTLMCCKYSLHYIFSTIGFRVGHIAFSQCSGVVTNLDKKLQGVLIFSCDVEGLFHFTTCFISLEGKKEWELKSELLQHEEMGITE